MMKMLLQLHAMLRFLVQCILFVGRTVGVRFAGCGMRSKWDINWQVVAWLHGFSFYCMVLHDASTNFIMLGFLFLRQPVGGVRSKWDINWQLAGGIDQLYP